MLRLSGIPASPGVALGTAVLVVPSGTEAAQCGRAILPDEVGAELARFERALQVSSEELLRLWQDMLSKVGKEQAAIFEAQRMMLLDPTLKALVESHIKEELVSAERAASLACEEQAKVLETIDDPYLAARAADLRDIGKRLVRNLTGGQTGAMPGELPEKAVIVAPDLTPSDTAALDVRRAVAIVLDKGGRTSHTAILARSLGIPAVVGTSDATSVIAPDDTVGVDGTRGEVVVNPEEEELSALREKERALTRERERLLSVKDLPAVTRDGKRVEIAANIGNVEDAYLALQAGAEGVGLFRTEFLFLDRLAMPSEEEQFEAYKKVLSAFAPRPVVIRTLDVGGDKPLPYLDMPKEDNPFLGLRAVRLCLSRRDLFRTQLRALLRASVFGNLRIMFPMISGLAELKEAKAVLEDARAELAEAGAHVSPDIQVGIMVEIPSAAVDADILAPECDFFSIGTNDLVQYTLACDRGNPSVAHLSDPFAPAVLRLIKRTIDEGHKRGIWVGMCGEMAGMPEAIPLLLAMGLDEFSMSAGAIPRAKEIVRRQSVRELEALWDQVKNLGTGQEIRRRLERL